MVRHASHYIVRVVLCTFVVVASAASTARAQANLAPQPTEAQSAAVKASPELVNGMAKEIGATPEQAASIAGVMLNLVKTFVKPDDFAAVSKALPGMDALLAAAPPALTPTPGFAASPVAADPMSSAMAAFPKIGITPDMIAKAVPFLSGYLKKYGGSAIGSMLEGLFKKAPK